MGIIDNTLSPSESIHNDQTCSRAGNFTNYSRAGSQRIRPHYPQNLFILLLSCNYKDLTLIGQAERIESEYLAYPSYRLVNWY